MASEAPLLVHEGLRLDASQGRLAMRVDFMCLPQPEAPKVLGEVPDIVSVGVPLAEDGGGRLEVGKA